MLPNSSVFHAEGKKILDPVYYFCETGPKISEAYASYEASSAACLSNSWVMDSSAAALPPSLQTSALHAGQVIDMARIAWNGGKACTHVLGNWTGTAQSFLALVFLVFFFVLFFCCATKGSIRHFCSMTLGRSASLAYHQKLVVSSTVRVVCLRCVLVRRQTKYQQPAYCTLLNSTQLNSAQPAVFYSTQCNSSQLNLLYFTQLNATQVNPTYCILLNSMQLNSTQLTVFYSTQLNELSRLYFTELSS